MTTTPNQPYGIEKMELIFGISGILLLLLLAILLQNYKTQKLIKDKFEVVLV